MLTPTGVTEWIVSRGVNPAWWGKLCEAVKKVLDNGFDVINMKQFKLSGYIPVCKAMLDLGPVWLDRYVRTVFSRIIENCIRNKQLLMVLVKICQSE